MNRLWYGVIGSLLVPTVTAFGQSLVDPERIALERQLFEVSASTPQLRCEITLIEPSATHYYQPGFTLVGAGVFEPGHVHRQEGEFIPRGVRWIQDRVVDADPDHNRLTTAAHGSVNYDFMVLCPGLQMDFGAIEGIRRDSLGNGNVHCIYDYRSAQNCWTAIQKLAQTGGRAIFSDTWTHVKCGGAPKKINLIAEDYCRQKGARGPSARRPSVFA